MSNVSILILTLNEEVNLQTCLEHLEGFDDVVVLDSFSTDGTEAIATSDWAKSRGVRFIQNKFDGWGPQQNWAMDHIDFKHKWVFYLDADEHMRPELKEEIERVAADDSEERIAFYCGRRNYFRGKWLKHAMPPGYIMRFFIPNHIRFERVINPVPTIKGPHGYLTHHFDHHMFSKGIRDWINRHNRYSSDEAEAVIEELRTRPLSLGEFFSKDPMTRRQAIKKLGFRLPFRPQLKFIYMYLFKLGFLDGYPGLVYCQLQSMYEWQIVIKTQELRRIAKGLPGS